MTVTRTECIQEIVAAYEAEFANLVDVWNTIEQKAQWVAIAAGGFLVAMFAFLRDGVSASGFVQRWLLTTVVVALLAALMFVARVFDVRKVGYPPTGLQIREMLTHTADLEDGERDAAYQNYLNDKMNIWGQAIASTDRHIRDKSRALTVAQIALAAALVLTGGMVLLRLHG